MCNVHFTRNLTWVLVVTRWPPPPDLMDGMEEYEVEKVLDSHWHGRGRKLQYLVKWVGYPDSDNQWVNWDDATGTKGAIREFKRTNSDRGSHKGESYSELLSTSSLPLSHVYIFLP
jgi:hypothetical protein